MQTTIQPCTTANASLFFLACVFLLTACQSNHPDQVKGQNTMAPAGQATPNATLEKAVMALVDGDYESFDEAMYQGPEATRAFFDAVRKSQLLCKALTEKYGPGAWEKFNQAEIDGKRVDISEMVAERDEVTSAFDEGIEFKIDGDVAVCVTPWNGRKTRFRRAANGVWYGDFGGETEFVAAFWTATNVGIDAVMQEVSKENVTILELKKAFHIAEAAYIEKFMIRQ